MADAVESVLEQWREARPDLDPSPIGVVGRVLRLARMWDREIREFLAQFGLEPGEFDILSTLRRSGEPDGLTASSFLRASLVTSGAITLRIDRMQAKGLVIRVRDPLDRRSIRISLSSQGLELVDRVLPLHFANHMRLIQELNGDERDSLEGILSNLLEARGDLYGSKSVEA